MDGLGVDDLCFLDGSETQGLSILGIMEADDIGFFKRFSCLRLILMKFHT